MRVDRLLLQDFRNYERAVAELAPGTNLVMGDNAQGKTNLLEGLYCLMGLGSPRGSDAVLVRRGAERAILRAELTRSGRTLAVDLEMRPGRGLRARLNTTPTTARELAGVTTAVFFGPDELSLVKGSPDGRRRFLDDLVVKLRPARDTLRREWERVLRQRNALLKALPKSPGRSGLEALEVWDETLCRVGAALTAARLGALARLRHPAARRYGEIAGEGEIELAYVSAWLAEPHGSEEDDPKREQDIAVALREEMTASRARELERGQSLVGPQRDDVSVSVVAGGQTLDVRSFGSQGEQRTAALALKLGEFDLLREALSETPLLLLDDVFSELDPQRRRWLSQAVGGAGQILLSSAEPDAVEAAGADRVIEVSSGRLSVRVR